MSKDFWRERSLRQLRAWPETPPFITGEPVGRKGSARHVASGYLLAILDQSSELRSGTLARSGLDSLEAALVIPGSRGLKRIGSALPSLHEGVGTHAILAKALDELRDELNNAIDIDWVRFQVDFCFVGNLRSIQAKTTKRAFQKEAAEAHQERFSKSLGDFKRYGAIIRQKGSLGVKETAPVLEGLLLSLRELDRDIGIHLAMIGEWQKRCEAPRASIRSIFRSGPPPVTGDGLTEKTPWEFPLSRMQGDGVAMAHEFMAWKGPEYSLNKQVLLHTDDENELLEYWDTDAGRFWFRYRMDPRISRSTG